MKLILTPPYLVILTRAGLTKTDRQYRKHMDFDKAISIIREASGTQLSPEVVDAFFRLVDKGEIKAK